VHEDHAARLPDTSAEFSHMTGVGKFNGSSTYVIFSRHSGPSPVPVQFAGHEMVERERRDDSSERRGPVDFLYGTKSFQH